MSSIAMLSSKLVKGATLKVYPGAPHGMCSTIKDQISTDLLTWVLEDRPKETTDALLKFL